MEEAETNGVHRDPDVGRVRPRCAVLSRLEAELPALTGRRKGPSAASRSGGPPPLFRVAPSMTPARRARPCGVRTPWAVPRDRSLPRDRSASGAKRQVPPSRCPSRATSLRPALVSSSHVECVFGNAASTRSASTGPAGSQPVPMPERGVRIRRFGIHGGQGRSMLRRSAYDTHGNFTSIRYAFRQGGWVSWESGIAHAQHPLRGGSRPLRGRAGLVSFGALAPLWGPAHFGSGFIVRPR
jgi:hypothetical protein